MPECSINKYKRKTIKKEMVWECSKTQIVTAVVLSSSQCPCCKLSEHCVVRYVCLSWWSTALLSCFVVMETWCTACNGNAATPSAGCWLYWWDSPRLKLKGTNDFTMLVLDWVNFCLGELWYRRALQLVMEGTKWRVKCVLDRCRSVLEALLVSSRCNCCIFECWKYEDFFLDRSLHLISRTEYSSTSK